MQWRNRLSKAVDGEGPFSFVVEVDSGVETEVPRLGAKEFSFRFNPLLGFVTAHGPEQSDPPARLPWLGSPGRSCHAAIEILAVLEPRHVLVRCIAREFYVGGVAVN